MNWYLQALKQYATFNGRARRKEYWFFVLFNVLALIGLTTLDVLVGTFSVEAEIGLFSGLYALAMVIPGLAVLVRRLHDTDRSGWWALLNLLPVVGALVVLVFTLLDSQPGANRFGPNPKGVTGTGTP
jgi:uncharacterized membrane protein YhaH (DUF805 family)